MSYATVAEANTYFGARLNYATYNQHSLANKEAALLEATARIDQLNFNGSKTDDDQVNQFPRDTDSDVPQNIKDACCEIALKLLEGYNDDLEFEDQRIIQQKVGQMSTFHDRSGPSLHKLAGIPSIIAWRLLLPYMRDPREVFIRRVS